MEIENLSQIGQNLKASNRKKSRKSTKAGKGSASGFLNAFNETVKETSQATGAIVQNLPALDGTETFEVLLDEVHEKGESLKKDALFGPLKEYRHAVKCFLRYIIDNCYEATKKIGTRNPRTMMQKKYLVIQVVDEKLESLATHVLKNQVDQLDILQRVDEINGILVDLSM